MNLRQNGARPLVIGHRGAAALAPENTLASLEAAVAAGADLVEFDVGPGLVLGHPGHVPGPDAPRLGEALAYLAERGVGAHVDLKVGGIEAEVAAVIHERGLAAKVVVSSTSSSSLRRLGLAAPDVPRVIGYPLDRVGAARIAWPRAVTAAGAASLRAVMPLRAPLLLSVARAQALALHHALVSAAVVRAVHGRGGALLAWTVNDPARVERLAALGVDSIVTDDPGMAVRVLAGFSGTRLH